MHVGVPRRRSWPFLRRKSFVSTSICTRCNFVVIIVLEHPFSRMSPSKLLQVRSRLCSVPRFPSCGGICPERMARYKSPVMPAGGKWYPPGERDKKLLINIGSPSPEAQQNQVRTNGSGRRTCEPFRWWLTRCRIRVAVRRHCARWHWLTAARTREMCFPLFMYLPWRRQRMHVWSWTRCFCALSCGTAAKATKFGIRQ